MEPSKIVEDESTSNTDLWERIAGAITDIFGEAAGNLFLSLTGVGFLFLLLFGVGYLVLRVVQALGPELFKQRLAAQISYEQTMAARVSELAYDHYWSITAASASLSVRLEDYLSKIESHAIRVAYKTGNGEMARLANDMAKEVAERSLPDLCRLIFLINRFQYVEGHAYLLVSEEAGRNCTRLHNRFTTALDASLAPKFAIMTIIAELNRVFDHDQKGDLSNMRWDKIDEKFCADKFKPQLDAWEHRLRWHLDKVATISISLRAYSELLDHELHQLFDDWFGSASRGKGDIDARLRRSQHAPAVSPSSMFELSRIRYQPALARSFEAATTMDRPQRQAVGADPGDQSSREKDEPKPKPPEPPTSPKSKGQDDEAHTRGRDAALGETKGRTS